MLRTTLIMLILIVTTHVQGQTQNSSLPSMLMPGETEQTLQAAYDLLKPQVVEALQDDSAIEPQAQLQEQAMLYQLAILERKIYEARLLEKISAQPSHNPYQLQLNYNRMMGLVELGWMAEQLKSQYPHVVDYDSEPAAIPLWQIIPALVLPALHLVANVLTLFDEDMEKFFLVDSTKPYVAFVNQELSATPNMDSKTARAKFARTYGRSEQPTVWWQLNRDLRHIVRKLPPETITATDNLLTALHASHHPAAAHIERLRLILTDGFTDFDKVNDLLRGLKPHMHDIIAAETKLVGKSSPMALVTSALGQLTQGVKGRSALSRPAFATNVFAGGIIWVMATVAWDDMISEMAEIDSKKRQMAQQWLMTYLPQQQELVSSLNNLHGWRRKLDQNADNMELIRNLTDVMIPVFFDPMAYEQRLLLE